MPGLQLFFVTEGNGQPIKTMEDAKNKLCFINTLYPLRQVSLVGCLLAHCCIYLHIFEYAHIRDTNLKIVTVIQEHLIYDTPFMSLCFLMEMENQVAYQCLSFFPIMPFALLKSTLLRGKKKRKLQKSMQFIGFKFKQSPDSHLSGLH